MPYRFAIVGCGNIAARHAAAIQQVGSVAGVCDPEGSRAQRLAEQFSSAAYNDIRHLLSATRPDVAVICTPSAFHPEHSIAAMSAGCHVLCEKPMALSSADAVRMMDASKKLNRRLFIVNQNRYNAPVQLLRNLLQEKRLGKVYSFQINCFWNRNDSYYKESPWRAKALLSGGTLFTQFSHFVDLLCWLLGDIKSVSGNRANFNHKNVIDFEDTGVAHLLLYNGSIGTIHYTVNTHSSNMEGSFTIFAEKGTVKIGGLYLNTIEYFDVEGLGTDDWQEAVAPPPVNRHVSVYAELNKALQNGTGSVADGSEGLKAVRAIEMIYDACPMIQ